ncbi:MAG: TRAP transporter substrate-binding protein DctP [Rhodospirillaceae bacterium]|jgi:TRAP-type transport system periplasmic protein|nr:TRAP transporter substrate-binding protein DctP [Rhodospirillaceae bacterium]MBT3886476.1 TRAP transporter substrate-binding protein DctP [Rhodospirillaceae bacterium]MBT4117939.1 TRAP transporter substrate-binding protein DctP [Rhodospirillaceae bacterium]MBT4671587.1 TRAP transporter substrate-binding protein DctP [Rhodospirillaceae bacterium]MBT4719817.1 TRAP transporter substrate-binding protein DctP [Rhodospirillaceae bacterium]
MYRKVLIAAAGLALLQTGSASAAGGDIKIGTFVPAKSVGVSRVIKPWMAKVKADLGDDVSMKGFWGGSLGKSPFKQYEIVKNGVADMTWVLPGYTPGQFPEMQVIGLPFLLENANEASLTIQRLHDAGMATGFGQVHLIGAWSAQPNSLFLREPIKSMGDLKKRKLSASGAVGGRFITAIGGIAQTVSAPKMTIMLNRRTIDGSIQGWTGMRTFKAMNLVKQAVEIPLGASPFLLLMNKKRWDGLSAKAKASFSKHGGETIARAGGQAYKAASDKIIGSNPQAQKIDKFVPNKAELDKVIALSKATVHKWWIEKTKNGQAVYDKALSIIADVRKGS